MSKDVVNTYAGIYESAIKATLEAAGKVPEANRMRQLQDGKAHPVWLMGHLTHSFNFFVNMWILGGKPVAPVEYGEIFAPDVMGSKAPSSNADDYPSWDELVANYEKSGQACVEGIRALNDEDLSGALRGDIPDQARGFFGDLGASILSMGTHDSYHRGQISIIGGMPE